MRRSVKEEPDHLRQNSIPLRQVTPVSIMDADDIGASSTQPNSSRSTMTDTTLNGDVPMMDTTATATDDPLYLFGRKGRELIQAVQKLQCLGIDTTLPSLPKVVVIGDQSAGKSSIIEAISDITLPRSEGTCTRCPFRITTHASQEGDPEWSCTISLQCESYRLPGVANGQSEFDGWAKYGQMDIVHFAKITSKTDLELTLRRAQAAMLNPSKSWRHFNELSADELDNTKYQVDFSPNVISLEITAPKLLELSFYDLPGAINVMLDEAQDYISEFVETLLKLYLNDDQALVVIACPANQDVETGTAMKYLRKCKAAGRAIGVLTKPDLVDITPTRLASFEKMLSGNGFRLDGGWFMCRQLSQRQLDQAARPTYDEARAQETNFFSSDPWTTRLAAYQDRFGIANFQKAVAKRHIQRILDSLPTIEHRLRERLNEVEKELMRYPEKPVQPGLEIMADIRNVVNAIMAKCSAESKESAFRANQIANNKSLAKQLQNAAPTVILSTPGYEKPPIPVDDDSEEMDETPSKRSRMNNGRASSVTPLRTASNARGTPFRTPLAPGGKRKTVQPPPQTPGFKTVFRLDDVKKRFDRTPSASLPDGVDARITHDLAKEATSCFSNLTQRALDKFETLAIQMLDDSVAESIAKRQGTELFNAVSSILRALLAELFQKEVDNLHHHICCLTHRPISYGKDWWTETREAHHTKLREGRDVQRVLEYFETLESQRIKVPAAIEDRKKKALDAAWVKATIDSPSYARELKELAIPLTFYDLASGQLVDTVARHLDYLIYQIQSRVDRELSVGLRPDEPERAAMLLVEDPQRELKRNELESEKNRLEEALDELKVLSTTET
ncbi:uncharacterized protein RHO25_001684 [Cercospora beticola]|uniref:Dynamin GTPase domain-containing protein n=2 Tax=Cercospora beticola TaxID=122368 RepID=A0ABZ0NC14_CERBT|nr:hypothetical protein RHO25_001684 [Cercospora beticola]